MYYIYHIPGIKIGVTQDVDFRVEKIQKAKEYEILEEHTDIYEVSSRELELQKEYGYKVDPNPYWFVVKVQHPKSKTPEALEKKSKARKGKPMPKTRERMLGNIQGYGTGRLYVEKTTGFIGHAYDHVQKFGVNDYDLIRYAKQDKPRTRGRVRGLHWAILDQPVL